MAKEFVARKLIITFDENNDFEGGLILYQLRENGIVSSNFKSIGIKNMPFSKIHLAKIIKDVIKKTKEKEGIEEDE